MGGFLGIGTSPEAEALKRQNELKQQEAARARRDAEIALAERKAKKGQEIANVKLGTDDSTYTDGTAKKKKIVKPASSVNGVSQSLGLGAGNTGVQV